MEKDAVIVAPAQFSIGNIVLLESNFSRNAVFKVLENPKVEHDSEIELNYSNLKAERFAVVLQYKFKVLYNGEVILTSDIKYSGEFKAEGELKESVIESFANINAPAILYPFIRENIASLTSKAMVGSIIIPPVNFIKLYEEKKKQDTEAKG